MSLAQSLGVRLEIVKTSWSTLKSDLQTNSFDIAMGGITITLDRQKVGLFSSPVFSSGKTPITRCGDEPKYETIAAIDQPGVHVIVNPGGTNERFDRAHLQKATIIQWGDNATIFDALVEGKADLMITGERRVMQEALFYGFNLEWHVPDDLLMRKVDRFVDLSEVRAHLGPYYSDLGRPSIDPELMIRMLIVGYCLGIRSERRLCDEVHLNLAYRWFCRLGLDGDVPDHSTFSKNRHGRFRESDLLRKLFETVVARCMKEGVVGGEAFAVDASIIVADAHRRRGVAKVEDLVLTSSRAVAEYLSVLDDAAFSGATPVEPKVISPTDPAARYTASASSVAGYAYSDKDGAIRYRAAQHDCDACMLKPKSCPNMLARKIARSVHEAARDKVRGIAKTEAYAVSCRERKKVEMLFAHLKRILRLGRLRLRGPNGAKDEFLLAATAQNLRKLARLIPLPAPIFAT